MADQKPTSNYYSNLGGINEKVSQYSTDKSQFLNIRNMDFYVPNALQKRPGSTQAITTGTSGAINSLHEYVRLDGASFIIAGDTGAMWLKNGSSGFTILSSGWTNSQPTDMLTFVNRTFMVNGQKAQTWGGSGSVRPFGLPCGPTMVFNPDTGLSASVFSVMGFTNINIVSFTQSAQLYAAIGYVREDGYFSPVDFVSQAVCITPRNGVSSGGAPYYWYAQAGNYGVDVTLIISGFSVAPNIGVTAFALYMALDVWSSEPNIGIRSDIIPSQVTGRVKSDVDTSRFYLMTLVPLSAGTSGFINYINSPPFGWTSTIVGGFDVAPKPAFSGMAFCFFDTYTPKYIDINQNIMFASGFSVAPSTVFYSEVGEPEVYYPENSFEVRTNDGDRNLGQKTFNNQILEFKETSFHKIIGDSADNLELIELSTEYGCLSNKTIVEFKERLIWLDRQGFVLYDGASWEVISQPVEDTLRRLNLSAARENACAVHFPYRSQIWFGVPIDDSTKNNVTIVYDYLVNAFTIFDGFNPASFGLLKGSLSTPTVFRGDYSGKIHYHNESFFGDNGAGITALALSRFEKDGENNTFTWRRIFLDVGTVSGLTGVISGRVFSDYNTDTVRATFSMYQDQFQSRAEMGVMAKAVSFEMAHVSASLPLLLNGYSWTRRYLRNV